MYLKQADLFWGQNQEFIKSVTAIGRQDTFDVGDVIFKAGEPADRFFVLIRGKVKLILGDTQKKVFASDNVGEMFGWSALIGCDSYSATGICEEPSVVLTFDTERMSRLLAKDAQSARLFFQQLASTLGKRLLGVYQMLE